VFNNGGVKRMWRWWEKSDPTRLASVPGLIGEPSLNDTLGSSLHLDLKDDPTSTFRKVSGINYPRTLKDLLAMTEAAREAKWGEQGEGEDLTSEFPVIGNAFFEDDSGDSSDSDEEQVNEALPSIETENLRKMDYSSVLPTAVRSTTDQTVNDTTETSKDADGITAGAASDMLTPMVKITSEYIAMSLNNQSPVLALGWKLGDFDVHYNQPILDSRQVPTKSNDFSATIDSFPSSKQGKKEWTGSRSFLLRLTVACVQFFRAIAHFFLQRTIPRVVCLVVEKSTWIMKRFMAESTACVQICKNQWYFCANCLPSSNSRKEILHIPITYCHLPMTQCVSIPRSLIEVLVLCELTGLLVVYRSNQSHVPAKNKSHAFLGR
jgi:hypothetical protein